MLLLSAESLPSAELFRTSSAARLSVSEDS
jgi:hypothetical protein